MPRRSVRLSDLAKSSSTPVKRSPSFRQTFKLNNHKTTQTERLRKSTLDALQKFYYAIWLKHSQNYSEHESEEEVQLTEADIEVFEKNIDISASSVLASAKHGHTTSQISVEDILKKQEKTDYTYCESPSYSRKSAKTNVLRPNLSRYPLRHRVLHEHTSLEAEDLPLEEEIEFGHVTTSPGYFQYGFDDTTDISYHKDAVYSSNRLSFFHWFVSSVSTLFSLFSKVFSSEKPLMRTSIPLKHSSFLRKICYCLLLLPLLLFLLCLLFFVLRSFGESSDSFSTTNSSSMQYLLAFYHQVSSKIGNGQSSSNRLEYLISQVASLQNEVRRLRISSCGVSLGDEELLSKMEKLDSYLLEVNDRIAFYNNEHKLMKEDFQLLFSNFQNLVTLDTSQNFGIVHEVIELRRKLEALLAKIELSDDKRFLKLEQKIEDLFHFIESLRNLGFFDETLRSSTYFSKLSEFLNNPTAEDKTAISKVPTFLQPVLYNLFSRLYQVEQITHTQFNQLKETFQTLLQTNDKNRESVEYSLNAIRRDYVALLVNDSIIHTSQEMLNRLHSEVAEMQRVLSEYKLGHSENMETNIGLQKRINAIDDQLKSFNLQLSDLNVHSKSIRNMQEILSSLQFQDLSCRSVEEKLMVLQSKIDSNDLLTRPLDCKELLHGDFSAEEYNKLILLLVNNLSTRSRQSLSSSKSLLEDESLRGYILDVIDAYYHDKSGLPDYALETVGGSIITVRCSQTYQYGGSRMSFLGIPLWYQVPSPRLVIQPEIYPGLCWPFVGTHGEIVIKLRELIYITAISYEHIHPSVSPVGNVKSAPKNFTVFGLQSPDDSIGTELGSFAYELNTRTLQTFTIPVDAQGRYEYVLFSFTSNHGESNYTCLYRLRVHGHL